MEQVFGQKFALLNGCRSYSGMSVGILRRNHGGNIADGKKVVEAFNAVIFIYQHPVATGNGFCWNTFDDFALYTCRP